MHTPTEMNYNASLTREQVLMIIKGGDGDRKMANKLGVSRHAVSRVRLKQTYKHITDTHNYASRLRVRLPAPICNAIHNELVNKLIGSHASNLDAATKELELRNRRSLQLRRG